MDQSEIPNAEQNIVFLEKKAQSVYLFNQWCTRWDSLEPSFEPKLFHFHWDI